MVLTNPVGRVEESGASGSSALGQEPRFASHMLQFFDERLAYTWGPHESALGRAIEGLPLPLLRCSYLIEGETCNGRLRELFVRRHIIIAICIAITIKKSSSPS